MTDPWMCTYDYNDEIPIQCSKESWCKQPDCQNARQSFPDKCLLVLSKYLLRPWEYSTLPRREVTIQSAVVVEIQIFWWVDVNRTPKTKVTLECVLRHLQVIKSWIEPPLSQRTWPAPRYPPRKIVCRLVRTTNPWQHCKKPAEIDWTLCGRHTTKTHDCKSNNNTGRRHTCMHNATLALSRDARVLSQADAHRHRQYQNFFTVAASLPRPGMSERPCFSLKRFTVLWKVLAVTLPLPSTGIANFVPFSFTSSTASADPRMYGLSSRFTRPGAYRLWKSTPVFTLPKDSSLWMWQRSESNYVRISSDAYNWRWQVPCCNNLYWNCRHTTIY